MKLSNETGLGIVRDSFLILAAATVICTCLWYVLGSPQLFAEEDSSLLVFYNQPAEIEGAWNRRDCETISINADPSASVSSDAVIILEPGLFAALEPSDDGSVRVVAATTKTICARRFEAADLPLSYQRALSTRGPR